MRQLCPGSGMDDGQPWMVGFHIWPTTGWAGAARGKMRDALRDDSTSEEECLRRFYHYTIVTILII